MWKEFNIWLEYRTRLNWGAPWHFFIVVTCTVYYIKFIGVTTMECWQMQVYTAVLLIIALIYEGWQIKKQGQTLRGCVEDMVMNGLGYITGIMSIL
jgi:hypothetical protein